MHKSIIVTGGAGFLGSNLCHRLVKEGHTVTAVDNLYTGRIENLRDLLGQPNFTFKEADIINGLDCDTLRSADQIYNLACPASPPHYQRDPIFTMKTSVLGTLKILEACAEHGIRLLHASTSEVYGDPLEHPQSENYWGNVNPIGVRSCYDEGKRSAETLCFDFNRQHNVDVRVVRIFNTYGPNMDPKDGRVVSNFINQALAGQNLTIYGEGTQTRSFCYVSDLLEGFYCLMNRKDPFFGPVNLGNPNEFTMLELAENILMLTKGKSSLTYQPLPQDDPIKRKPDISRAVEFLDWGPVVQLEEGLKKTIEYFQEIYSPEKL